MKQALKIEVDCSEKTCSTGEPRKFCNYLGIQRLGQIYTCCLFPRESHPWTELKQNELVTPLRCEACLKAQEGALPAADHQWLPSASDMEIFGPGASEGSELEN